MLVLYANATKQRPSRQIECHCRQDVAYRVITGNLVPDHATIARFVVRHETALADLFSEVLRLCDQAGLVKPGLVAIDGTRLTGNASRGQTREFSQIAREILAEHTATDAAEDRQHGDTRGDELPEQLHTPEGRRRFFRDARRNCEDQQTTTEGHGGEEQPEGDDPAEGDTTAVDDFTFDAELIVVRVQGREGWARDARRQLEQRRWKHPDPIRRSREDRLLLAAEQLEADLDADCRGNQAYEEHRAAGRMKDGRRFGKPPNPSTPPQIPDGKVNVTDPDSKHIKATDTYVQGYNAQAVVDRGQIVLAAEITNSTVDWSQLDPMITAALSELELAGVTGRLETAVADTQYWNEQHMDEVIANKHVQVLIPPDSVTRDTPRPGWTGGRYTWMGYVLAAELGDRLYRQRKHMIEPVFGHTKHNRGVTRFHRRGRTAVRTEWRLLMATHNLTKLHRHQIATAGP